MKVFIKPFRAMGSVNAPPSKSFAHRYLIAAALKKGETLIRNVGYSDDVKATADCLRVLGAKIEFSGGNATVCGITKTTEGEATLNVGESGSTLRFLMPVVAALGVNAEFKTGKSLLNRPADELLNVLSAHGEKIEKIDCGYRFSGKITAGAYSVSTDVSSQYASGLAFALPLLNGESRLEITGKNESEGYIGITLSALEKSGIEFKKSGYKSIIFKKSEFQIPNEITVGGDYSSAAFLLSLGAIGGDVTVCGLNADGQGDERIKDILRGFGAEITEGEGFVRCVKRDLKPVEVDFSSVPDLAPVVCAAAAFADGVSRFHGVERLKFKESDRLFAITDMLKNAGIKTDYLDGTLKIYGGKPSGGAEFNGFNDHRIVMASIVLASALNAGSLVKNAESVSKSYPDFFADLEKLGGKFNVNL